LYAGFAKKLYSPNYALNPGSAEEVGNLPEEIKRFSRSYNFAFQKKTIMEQNQANIPLSQRKADYFFIIFFSLFVFTSMYPMRSQEWQSRFGPTIRIPGSGEITGILLRRMRKPLPFTRKW